MALRCIVGKPIEIDEVCLIEMPANFPSYQTRPNISNRNPNQNCILIIILRLRPGTREKKSAIEYLHLGDQFCHNELRIFSGLRSQRIVPELNVNVSRQCYYKFGIESAYS